MPASSFWPGVPGERTAFVTLTAPFHSAEGRADAAEPAALFAFATCFYTGSRFQTLRAAALICS